MDARTAPPPPRARKTRHSTRHHGILREDPYHWLRAENWQEVMRDPARLDPAIRAHLEAENAHAAAVMADTAELQRRLFVEMKGRIKEEDATVPAPDGPYAYYVSHVAGGQQPRYCRQPRLGGAEQVLVDGNALAQGKAFFRLGGVAHSPDHLLMVYGFDETGGEYYTLRIRDIAAGRDFDDAIASTTGGAVWSADGRTLFYVWNDEQHRPCKVFRHAVGRPPSEDTLVYAESDPGFFVGIGKTLSDRFVVIHAHDHETSETRLIDAGDPMMLPRLLAPRESGHEYHVEHQGERLLILTNGGGAEDFEIVEAPLAAPERARWRPLVPHKAGRFILGHAAYRQFLVRLEREDGLPRLVITDTAGHDEHAISFREEAYSLALSEGFEHDTTLLRFTYSSMTTPAQVYDYDMATRERILRKTQEVPSGHDPAAYVTRRILAPAPDGASVPISLLHRADTALDGSAPCLLYGYGAYGLTMPASFSTGVLSLVDRGLVYAIAHTRGGKDKGYRWYRDGKRERKMNTFTDFIAAARHLVAQRIVAERRIVAQGGSAGGMLMGAVANIAPDTFGGIIAEVPFVDVLATMLDASLPLTPPEWTEWGNPIEREADYRTIAAYSPCDNVRAQDYPDILAVAGLTDPRVTYWEPAKWVARLRELKTDDNLLLLKTQMEAGHAGAPGRFDRLKEVAFVYAFALKVTGKLEAAMPEARVERTT